MLRITARANTAQLTQGGKRLADELETVVALSAYAVEGRAKIGAPVDTGALRASIYARTWKGSGYSSAHGVASALRPGQGAREVGKPANRHEAFVAAGVRYAVFVEYGSRGRPGRFFMSRALRQVAPRFRADVARAVRSLTR